MTDTLHGVKITDPYRWLEDQDSPETRDWIDKQNAYTRSILDHLPGREQVRRRLEELFRVDSVGLPVERAGRYFFTKRFAHQNQRFLAMRRSLRGGDEILVDPNTMDRDQTTSVNLLDVSEDGKWVIYGLRQGGEDETTLSIMDVEAHNDLPDRLPRARYNSVSMKPDKSGFYYVRHMKEQGSRVYYHAIGSDPSRDKELFGKRYGPGQIMVAQLSEDGGYLLMHVLHGSNAKKVEVYVQNLRQGGPITTIVNDLDARFFGEIGGDQLFLNTDWQAPNGRIIRVDLKNPARQNWREIVPETSSVIQGLSAAGGKLAVNYLEEVKSRVKIFDPSGKHLRDIQFPMLGSVTELYGRWSSGQAFYAFTSFVQPFAIYRYQTASGEQDLWFRPNVPVTPGQFEIKQVWYASKDRTRVPMFLVYRKGLRLDGNRPALLTGYGGFNLSTTPYFSPRAVIWAEAGGVFAVANLRGGGEFGENWHHAGMMENKQNVFDDFIAAAEWLIASRYTRPSRLAIAGRSNGGLLVGAAMTQRPDLFKAVDCGYPLLDMIRYHKFLLARLWVSEYGSADDAQQFQYISKYSPYQNVINGTKYPAVLFVSGDSDTRVDPLHARKMTARMQVATSSGRPVLLRYDTKAGHSGGLPVSKQIEEETDELIFLLSQIEATPVSTSGPPGS